MKSSALRITLVALMAGGPVLTTYATLASAQAEDRIASLIELVRRRPDGKDRDKWRDERRDAARELGDSGDKRAVPVLIQVVKDEQFDAVGEIAIVALGKLGDTSAVPVLQSVADDSSRDRFVRQAARDALRQLGSDANGGDDDDDDDDESSLASTGLSNLGSTPTSTGPVKMAPAFADDILEAREELTFAVGESHIDYDSISKEASFSGRASSHYLHLREGKSMALRYEARADVTAGAVNYEGGDSSSRLANINLAAAAEARFYSGGGKLFGLAGATALLGFDHLRINRPGDDNTTLEYLLAGDLDLALGGGYGRVLNVGESMRVSRIEDVLRKRRILGRPIGAELAERIMRAWWELRYEQGFHDRLTATVAQLREAGVLLGEPDAGASYAILQVLEDGQLDNRLEGLRADFALGESLLMRDDSLGLEEGRIESLLSRVSYGLQNSSADNEVRIEGLARYRILAEGMEASPWALLAQAHWRDYHYGKNSDPMGALDLGVDVGASDDGLMGSEMATRLAGSAGWLWAPSRATQFRLAAQMRIEGGEMFVGAVFDGQYGLIDAGYLGAGARP